ncbi:hypothetical protein BU17DRAFT_42816 [Hysterangium stoloniferum]|nr:hypothetical protein BU17DRAFT_42816 [Hysterangium stoloniferum]
MLLQFILGLFLLTLAQPHNVDQHPILQHEVSRKTPVQITLGVMSRCPDALLCETVLDSVFQETWPLVNVSLSFIGTLNGNTVTCLHGPMECTGNIHQLCAMDLAPEQQTWWEFLQCLNFEGKDNVGDPELAQRCAGVANIPWEDQNGSQGMKSCVESAKGERLLRKSVAHSASLGITKSCSIMISGKIRCIHDSTWKDCETGHTQEEFKEYIQKEYVRLNAEGLHSN